MRGRVPCQVWVPASGPRRPVVLLAHGGSGHKSGDRNLRFANWLVSQADIACLVIDGPFHGERRVRSDGPYDYQWRVAQEGARQVHERVRADWLAALDAAGELVDIDRVGFLGMSMGARYGLAVCAALGPRLRCAVLGKFGLTCHPELAKLAADDLIRDSAAAIGAPVLFHAQRHDEVFPIDGQAELFNLLSSRNKQLRIRPGPHHGTRPGDEASWLAHLVRCLGDGMLSCHAR